jgi:hypothetical protein
MFHKRNSLNVIDQMRECNLDGCLDFFERFKVVINATLKMLIKDIKSDYEFVGTIVLRNNGVIVDHYPHVNFSHCGK